MAKTLLQIPIPQHDPTWEEIPVSEHDDYGYRATYGDKILKIDHKSQKTGRQRWEFANGGWFEMCIVGNQFKNKVGVTSKQIDYNGGLSYAILPNQLKENVVLSNIPPQNYIDFEVTYSGVFLVIQDHKLTVFGDFEEEIHKRLIDYPKVFLQDDNGVIAYADINVIAESDDGTTFDKTLRYVIDSNWLSSAAYPVNFDPTTVITASPTRTTRWWTEIRNAENDIIILTDTNDTGNRDVYCTVLDGDDGSSVNTYTVMSRGAATGYVAVSNPMIDTTGRLWCVVCEHNGSGWTHTVYNSEDHGVNWTKRQDSGSYQWASWQMIITSDDTCYSSGTYPNINNTAMYYWTAATTVSATYVAYMNGSYGQAFYDPATDYVWWTSDKYGVTGPRFRLWNNATKSWVSSQKNIDGVISWGFTPNFTAVQPGYFDSSGYFVHIESARNPSDSIFRSKLIQYNYGSNTPTVLTDYSSYNSGHLHWDEIGDTHLLMRKQSDGALYYSRNNETPAVIFTPGGGETLNGYQLMQHKSAEKFHPWKTYNQVIITTADATYNYIKLLDDVVTRLPVAV